MGLAGQAHVEQRLRKQRDIGQHVGQRGFGALRGLQHLQCTDDAVAGGVFVQRQQVA